MWWPRHELPSTDLNLISASSCGMCHVYSDCMHGYNILFSLGCMRITVDTRCCCYPHQFGCGAQVGDGDRDNRNKPRASQCIQWSWKLWCSAPVSSESTQPLKRGRHGQNINFGMSWYYPYRADVWLFLWGVSLKCYTFLVYSIA
jgi:hypothetical protein